MTRFAQLLFLFSAMALVQPLAAQTLEDEIDGILLQSPASSNTWGILIQSDEGAINYYQRNRDLELTPASNTKLVTTAGAFGVMGPDHAFETRVYYNGDFSGGTLDGDINLVVEHDITWNVFCLGSSDEALDHLADQLAAQGLQSVTGQVNVYGAAFYGRGQFDDVRFSAPSYDNATAASVFRTSLAQAGVSVSGGSSGRTGFTAPGDLVYTHLSSDLLYENEEGRHAGLREMPLTLATASIESNRVSHNAMADGLLMAIGYQASGQSTLDAGAAAVLDWLENEAGIDTRQLVFGDGSGLARGADSRPGNEFSPVFYVQLIRHMIDSYPTWDTTLSIGCEDGTIGGRYCSPSYLQGRVHAKTGTLFTTIALSGYLDHPLYGERIYFSFLANNSSGISATAARNTIEEIIVTIANGFPPVTPGLSHVAQVDSASLQVEAVQQFSALDNMEVEYSVDGGAFSQSTPLPLAQPYVIETRPGQQNTADYQEVQGVWADTSAETEAPGSTGAPGGRWAIPTDSGGPDIARFAPSGLETGRYEVDVTTYGTFLSDNAHQVTARINDANGIRERLIDLSFETTGDVWRPVAVVNFVANEGHYIEFDNSTQLNAAGSSSNSRMVMSAVRFVPTTGSVRLDSLAQGTRIDARVVGKSGATTTAPSDTYSGRIDTSPRVLLVDGNDRWATQPENPAGESHDFVTRIGASITNVAFDSADNDSVVRGDVVLEEYPVVVYLLGEESTQDETFSDTEQGLLNQYLDNGGRVIVSGAEFGWDLEEQGTASDREFLRESLRIDYTADATSASTEGVVPEGSDLFAGISNIDYSAGPLSIGFPDVLAGMAGSRVVMRYEGTSEGAALAWRESAGPGAVAFGFPITMISDETAQSEVIEAALDYLLEQQNAGSAWIFYGQ